LLSALLIVTMALTACATTPEVEEAPPVEPVEEEEVFPGIPADLIAKVREEGSSLNVYNWSFYIDEGRVEKFEELYGIDVTYDLYESDAEMKAKVMAGGSGYDVVYPEQDALFELIQLDLVQPINHDWIPNMKHTMDKFINPSYDPGNTYSTDNLWGTTGYCYNTTKVGDDPRLGSWELIFEGEEYAGHITMLDDYGSIIGAALKYLGYSLNSADPGELMEAQEVLLAQKPLISAYISGPVREQLISGDVWIAQLWGGDCVYVSFENPDIAYVFPEEGGEIWVGTTAIPTDAPHPATAHLWMNYVQYPEVQAAIVEYVYYPSGNAAAQELLPAEILENPAVYPPEDALEKGEFFEAYTGDALTIREAIWDLIKE
jgi:spermidine/putrescine-binding protein